MVKFQDVGALFYGNGIITASCKIRYIAVKRNAKIHAGLVGSLGMGGVSRHNLFTVLTSEGHLQQCTLACILQLAMSGVSVL
jgi:hypothetical protein